MKLKQLLCTLFAGVMLLLIPSSVFAEDYYTIDMNEYDLGFTVQMPSSYSIFSSLDDPSLAELGFFFDSADTPDYSVPGFSLNCGYEDMRIDFSSLEDSTDEQFNAFINGIFDALPMRYGMNVDGDILIEDIDINGNNYIHLTFPATGGGRTAFFDNYYIVINDNLIRFSAIAFTNDGDTAYAAKAAELSETMVSSVVVTGTVGYSEGAPQQSSAPAEENQSFYQKLISFQFPLWIFLAGLAIILLSRVNVAKRKEWQPEALSLDNSKCIQGFCALAIIIHHMSQNILFAGGDTEALSIMTDAGVLFVGVFFFFSGFGLFKSLKTKENYLNGFFKKRLPTILVPFYSCILVIILTGALVGDKFKPLELLGYLSGWLLINSHMWYIVEIAILYIAFFLIFRFIKNDKIAIPVMTVFTGALVVGSLLLGHGENWFQGEWWYNSTFLFAIGIIVSRFEKPLASFAKKFYPIILPVTVAAFALLFRQNLYMLNTYSYWADTRSSFMCLGVQLPAVIMFVLALLLVMMKVKFSNPTLKFLGKISLELYLIHNLFINCLRSMNIMNIPSNSMYILGVIVCAIILATVINGFDKYIISLLTGKVHPTKFEENDKKIHSIDMFRLFAAFLVVSIHIPFENMTAGGITIAFGKIAVPFFLVVCGYFLYRDNDGEFMTRLKKQALKIFILTVAANVFYLLWELAQSLLSGGNIGSFIATSFTKNNIIDFLLWNMSPFGDHLWYLGSLLYAILITMLLSKTKLFKKAMFIAPVLLAGYIFLSWTQDPAKYFVYRNALLCTLPYLMFGCMIKRYQENLMKINLPWYLLAAVVLCVTNVLEYNLYGGNLGVPYFSAELLVYVVVLLALKLPSLGAGTLAEKLGRDCSLFVYIVHIAVISLLYLLPVGTYPNGFTALAPITIFVVTLIIAVIWNFLKSLLPEKAAQKK